MPNLIVVGYELAGTAYAGLAILLLTQWRQRVRGSLLLLAVVATIGWAIAGIANSAGDNLLSLVAEVCKGLAWIIFLSQAFAGTSGGTIPPALRVVQTCIAISALVLGVWVAQSQTAPFAHYTVRGVRDAAGLALALVGCVCVYHVVRNAREGRVWAVKYLWLSAASIFAYDVVLFSVAFVSEQMFAAVAGARGFALVLLVPLLAVGVTRIEAFRPQVFMSQRLAFVSVSVVISALYLGCVILVGYYVRGLGGKAGDVLQVLVVFAATLGLVSVAASKATRARLRVGLAKHLFPYRYDYREEWLDLTRRLTHDSASSSLAERTMDAFVRLGGATGGSIFVANDGVLQLATGDLFADRPNLNEPADGDFCEFLQRHEWIVDLDRARARHGRDAEVPLPPWLADSAESWLAIPLLHQRKIYALVILRRPMVERRFAWEELDLLRTAGHQAASYFALAATVSALLRERQFASLNRVTAFLIHDLSNIAAQQRLVVENAARHKANPAFVDDAIATIDSTVSRMGRLLERLKSGALGAPSSRIHLTGVCNRVIARLSGRTPRPVVSVTVEVEVVCPVERLEQVLEHVVSNAQDATPATGSVTITIGVDGEYALVEVADTGRGMDEEFIRTRLFTPFDTTKGARGLGLGAFQAREFARDAGGDVVVSSTPGSGTLFVLRLPRAA